MVTIFNNDRNSNQNNTESSSYFHQKVDKKNHKGQYMLVRMWNKGCTLPKQVSFQTGTNALENNLQVIRKLELVLPEYLTILLLDMYPKDSPQYHKDMCSSMFIAALLVIARN